jgi:perosamine synthetase
MRSIPLMAPKITEDDIAAAADVLRSGLLVQGKNVEALEKAVGEYIGAKHVIAASSGTATLHMALVALGVGPGDEVIVPAFSYVATANVVEIVGAKPVFVDIDDATFNIDVSQIDQAITTRTRAIMPVHEFGLCCDISRVVEIARRHGLAVIEDAACALGATENGKFAGTFGEIGSFSLHPRKSITSGEGGLLTTDEDELAAKLRTLRNHGIDSRGEFVAAGFNYRLTDFQAALVLSQFGRFDESIRKKAALAEIYSNELSGVDKIRVPHVPGGKNHTWQTYHVLIDDGIDRGDVIAGLQQNGIGTNYGAQCIPALKYYREKYGLDCERLFPNAMRAFEHGLAVPMYEKLSEDDVRFVAASLRDILD